jgi:hypothetical protein
MKSAWMNPDKGPTPEQLAAYADGELADAERAAIEAWLQHEPSAAAEVEAQRRLTQTWRDAEPPQPSEETWAGMYQKIEAGLNAPVPGAKNAWPRRLLVSAATLGAAAAAVFLLVLLRDGYQPLPPVEEPYAVVSAKDVAILCINGDDTGCLVAARPPIDLIGEQELATPNDAEVLNREPHIDGILADMRFQAGAPMLITPPAGWERDP